MPNRLIDPPLTNSEFEFEDDFVFHDVDPKLLMALTFLVGYQESNKKTWLLRVDGSGNLLVSTEGTASTSLQNSVATVATTATLVVAERADRKSLFIRNTSAHSLWLGDDTGVTTANGMFLDSGDSIVFENFIGDLYGIASQSSTEVRVGELV